MPASTAKPGVDGNLAFMSSSNDQLFSSVDLNGLASSGHASSSIASPSYAALAQFGSPPNGPSVLSPQREQIMSASAVPLPPSRTNSAQLTPLLTAADEPTWQVLYNKLQGVIDEERHLWKVERQKLLHEIQLLRQEVHTLQAARVDSGTASASAKENAYFNQDVVAQAQEKLRQFSQVSPHSSRDPSVAGVRDGLCGNRLPSITEERPSREELARRVSFPANEHAAVSVVIQEDNPYTPTATHAALSPPPENFVRHAGHTPRISRSHRESFVEGEQPTAVAKPTVEPEPLAAPVDDPPLKGPLVLASSPQDNPFMLEDLSHRLQEVADHPDDNVPEALQGRTSLESEFAAPEPAAESKTVVEGGIRLKAQRSMNFGRPLGE